MKAYHPLAKWYLDRLACAAWSGLLAGIALSCSAAYGNLVAYDEFDYGMVGSDLNGNGGGSSFGFSGMWSGQTSFNVGSGSLFPPTNPLPLVGNSVTAVAFGDNRGIDRSLSTALGVEGTSIYVSVLMEPRGILHQGAYNGWFALVLRGSTDVVVGMSSFGDKYGLEVGFENSQSNVSAAIGKTAFFVLRIDFTEGVDPVHLYVNPTTGGPEPAIASGSLINLNVNFLNMVSLAGPGGIAYDAIRIGTTFADVAPATSDFDADGDVDVDDLSQWSAGYDSIGDATQGDADADLDVDGADFLIWQRQLGFQLPSEDDLSTAIPEAGAMQLIGLGVLITFHQIRRRLDACGTS